MSGAWEITVEDVQTVLTAHQYCGEQSAQELLDNFISPEADRIEDGVLYYTNMEAQTNSMLDDIEDILLENGIIEGLKHFHPPGDDENYMESLEDTDEFLPGDLNDDNPDSDLFSRD